MDFLNAYNGKLTFSQEARQFMLAKLSGRNFDIQTRRRPEPYRHLITLPCSPAAKRMQIAGIIRKLASDFPLESLRTAPIITAWCTSANTFLQLYACNFTGGSGRAGFCL